MELQIGTLGKRQTERGEPIKFHGSTTLENHIGELHWRTAVEIQFSFWIWRLKPGEKGKMAEKEQFGDTVEKNQKAKRRNG